MSACAELISACAELILGCAQVNVRPTGEVKVNFLALLGNFRFLLKRLKVLIKLFQKFAEHEAEPRTNAKASAFATMLQKGEALLLLFGQSQYFPNVGKYCALSPPALSERGMAIECLCLLRVHTGNFTPTHIRGRYPIILHIINRDPPLTPLP